MPPKIKTDRNTIINAAFEIARDEGVTSITAQSVSAVLKTSVAPIFREFQTVEELRIATAEKVHEFHAQYIQNFPQSDLEFLSYGIAYIHFAKEYPHLFEMIMQPGRITMEERMTGQLSFVVNSAGHAGAIPFEQAKELFFNVWIYTHGIACLVYKGSFNFTDEEIKLMLLNAFTAFHKTSQTKSEADSMTKGDAQ